MILTQKTFQKTSVPHQYHMRMWYWWKTTIKSERDAAKRFVRPANISTCSTVLKGEQFIVKIYKEVRKNYKDGDKINSIDE